MADEQDIIGIQLDSQESAPPSLLASFGTYDIVEIYNPLSKPFRGVVSRSIPMNTPETPRDREMRLLYGTDLRNPDRNGRNMNHVQQGIIIESGKTKKLPGDVAKVVATQLINEMMQREGATNKLADPVQRRAYEERVVINSVKQYEEANVLSVEDRLAKQIDDLNKVEDNKVEGAAHEPTFPTVQPTTITVPEQETPATAPVLEPTNSPTTGAEAEPRKRGRPPKVAA